MSHPGATKIKQQETDAKAANENKPSQLIMAEKLRKEITEIAEEVKIHDEQLKDLLKQEPVFAAGELTNLADLKLQIEYDRFKSTSKLNAKLDVIFKILHETGKAVNEAKPESVASGAQAIFDEYCDLLIFIYKNFPDENQEKRYFDFFTSCLDYNQLKQIDKYLEDYIKLNPTKKRLEELKNKIVEKNKGRLHIPIYLEIMQKLNCAIMDKEKIIIFQPAIAPQPEIVILPAQGTITLLQTAPFVSSISVSPSRDIKDSNVVSDSKDVKDAPVTKKQAELPDLFAGAINSDLSEKNPQLQNLEKQLLYCFEIDSYQMSERVLVQYANLTLSLHEAQKNKKDFLNKIYVKIPALLELIKTQLNASADKLDYFSNYLLFLRSIIQSHGLPNLVSNLHEAEGSLTQQCLLHNEKNIFLQYIEKRMLLFTKATNNNKELLTLADIQNFKEKIEIAMTVFGVDETNLSNFLEEVNLRIPGTPEDLHDLVLDILGFGKLDLAVEYFLSMPLKEIFRGTILASIRDELPKSYMPFLTRIRELTSTEQNQGTVKVAEQKQIAIPGNPAGTSAALISIASGASGSQSTVTTHSAGTIVSAEPSSSNAASSNTAALESDKKPGYRPG